MFEMKVVEKPEKHIFLFNNYFLPENRAIHDIMWKNIVGQGRAGQGRPPMTWTMNIAYWIPKATNTHSEYVILIAFPLQQWLHERASILRYMYTVLF